VQVLHGCRDGPTHGSRTSQACPGKVSPKFVFLEYFHHTGLICNRPEQKRLEIMVGDFVKAELPFFDVCISNTPYQVNYPPSGLYKGANHLIVAHH
jgi:hypothetical protein